MRDAAFGVVFDKTRSKILLVKRRDVPIWVLPGGGIDDGELSEAAAVREVKEETGLQCTVVRHVALYKAKNSIAADTYLFELKEDKGELSLSDETVDVGYFAIDALPQPFFPVHSLWIQDTLLSKESVILKPIEGVTVKSVIAFALKNPKIFFLYLASRLGFRFQK